MDNTGQFLYVSNTTSGNVEVFGVDQNTGALTQRGSSSIGFNIIQLIIDASNQFAYVGQNGGGVYGFLRDSTTGLLTALPGFPITTESPQGVPFFGFDPSGRFLYITNQATNSVGVWTIDGSGNLTQIPGSPFPAGVAPSSVATCTADVDQALAGLSGGNFFTGNQTVSGVVFATSFSGDGTGLTGVNAAFLGGIAPSNYARVDVGNNFTGSQSVTGNVSASGNLSSAGTTTIGGGTPIVKHLSATFSPTFGALKASTCTTATFTLTGASDGDTLALGVPNARTTGGGTIVYFAWVSAANTVTMRAAISAQAHRKLLGQALSA